MKIVFLDEYSVCGRSLESITRQGEYTGYDTTSPDEVLSHCKGAEVVISNKVVLDAPRFGRFTYQTDVSPDYLCIFVQNQKKT